MCLATRRSCRGWPSLSLSCKALRVNAQLTDSLRWIRSHTIGRLCVLSPIAATWGTHEASAVVEAVRLALGLARTCKRSQYSATSATMEICVRPASVRASVGLEARDRPASARWEARGRPASARLGARDRPARAASLGSSPDAEQVAQGRARRREDAGRQVSFLRTSCIARRSAKWSSACWTNG